MEDITPGLLEKIQKQFYHDIEKSSIIKNFKKQAQRGKTSYSQANEVAQEIGKILAAIIFGTTYHLIYCQMERCIITLLPEYWIRR